MGYDPNGLGYRVAELPSFNVRTALHVTFVENFFPCVTKVTPYLGEFMTADQQRRYTPVTVMMRIMHVNLTSCCCHA